MANTKPTIRGTGSIIKDAVDDAMLMLKYAAQQGYDLQREDIDINIVVAVSHKLGNGKEELLPDEGAFLLEPHLKLKVPSPI
ncbi:hypothetical protein, partial [Candidatus Entotheonella palauensis]|uniref:hypothetical protein n=1 Tax=Candidatus Entotheonella palauensis TaxID=93172 RepID=UPI00117885C9